MKASQETAAFRTVTAPHVNANDVELLVVEWLVKPWQRVHRGTPLCAVETTKAVLTVESTCSGFVHPIAAERKTVRVGEPLAHIFPTDDPKQLAALSRDSGGTEASTVSKKARELMEKFGLKPSDFPPFTAISSAIVIAKIRELQRDAAPSARTAPGAIERVTLTPSSVLVWGEPNSALLAIDAFESAGELSPAAFMDDAAGQGDWCGLPTLAPDTLASLAERGLRRAFLCGRDAEATLAAAKACKDASVEIVSAIHKTAAVSRRAKLGVGVLVGAMAAVGPEVQLDDYSRVLCGATVAHHTRIGRFASVCDGAHLGGNVEVGERAFLGIGVVVNKRVRLGAGCTVVSGATVVDHVGADMVVRLNGTAARRPGHC
ncbi:MAG: hypothetical protein HY077_13585 [Elusimicrobia bacterium]|nr:hypothetical protein [Elusimicrobiota bacterium]